MPSTCLGVVRDNGRWAATGWIGGGVEGRDGKHASFCKVAAVSVKPDKTILHYVIIAHEVLKLK